MLAEECQNEFHTTMNAFNDGCFASASEGPPSCDTECAGFDAWDASCPDATFDGLGLTNCDCNDNCPADGEPCPAEMESTTTKASIRGNFLNICSTCGPLWQAIGQTCGNTDADTCAAYTTFLADCPQSEFLAMGMTNCNCNDDCPAHGEPCPADQETPVTWEMVPDRVTGCNGGTAC
jgi:hypothetical protein